MTVSTSLVRCTRWRSLRSAELVALRTGAQAHPASAAKLSASVSVLTDV